MSCKPISNVQVSLRVKLPDAEGARQIERGSLQTP